MESKKKSSLFCSSSSWSIEISNFFFFFESTNRESP
jgi:hypothetical protein